MIKNFSEVCGNNCPSPEQRDSCLSEARGLRALEIAARIIPGLTLEQYGSTGCSGPDSSYNAFGFGVDETTTKEEMDAILEAAAAPVCHAETFRPVVSRVTIFGRKTIDL